MDLTRGFKKRAQSSYPSGQRFAPPGAAAPHMTKAAVFGVFRLEPSDAAEGATALVFLEQLHDVF